MDLDCSDPLPKQRKHSSISEEEFDRQQKEIEAKALAKAEKMRKKHLRRTTREIERNFVCPYKTC